MQQSNFFPALRAEFASFFSFVIFSVRLYVKGFLRFFRRFLGAFYSLCKGILNVFAMFFEVFVNGFQMAFKGSRRLLKGMFTSCVIKGFLKAFQGAQKAS